MGVAVTRARAQSSGLAGRLVRFCLDDIRAQGLRVDPACPFVAAYIRKNPEYSDLVAGS